MTKKDFLFLSSFFFLLDVHAGDLRINPAEKTQQLWDHIWGDEADAKTVKALLDQGANPHDRQFEFGAIEEGWDMLTAALFQAHFTLVKPLLHAGLDPNKSLFPPISFISSLVHGYEGCCKMRKSKDDDHADYCFFSRAQKKFHDKNSFKNAYVDTLTLLLVHKADVNSAIDGQSKTALAMACERGHDDVCTLLLKYGAKE